MSLLDDVLSTALDPFTVRRRAAGVLDEDTGDFTPAAWTSTVVVLSVQSTGKNRSRTTEGDASAGTIDVWATLADLAAVGWTGLQIAPSEFTEGPPGDRIDWDGREYEISRAEPHDGQGPLIDPFRRYTATQIGASP